MEQEDSEFRRNRLAKLVKEYSLSGAAKLLGKPDRQLNDMLAGRKSFGAKVARAMERYAMENSSKLNLFYFDGEDAGTDTQMANQSLAGDYVIKQYNDVHGAMGGGLILRDQPGQITGWRVTSEWIEKNLPNNTGKANLCIVTGFGDSMRGMFNSGDPLIVDVGVREVKFDGVYFFRVGEEGFIKRLQRIPGDGIRAISENKSYETWTITADMDFEVFGRVLKVWKSEGF